MEAFLECRPKIAVRQSGSDAVPAYFLLFFGEATEIYGTGLE